MASGFDGSHYNPLWADSGCAVQSVDPLQAASDASGGPYTHWHHDGRSGRPRAVGTVALFCTLPGGWGTSGASLLAGALYPIETERGPVRVGPGGHLALVAGYASRTFYFWSGGGWQRYARQNADRRGDLWYASLVAGWRPPLFRRDYPKPDWRVFGEILFEATTPDRKETTEVYPAEQRLFAGPSVLGLYGKWGLSAGVLFPLTRAGSVRLGLNVSYWL